MVLVDCVKIIYLTYIHMLIRNSTSHISNYVASFVCFQSLVSKFIATMMSSVLQTDGWTLFITYQNKHIHTIFSQDYITIKKATQLTTLSVIVHSKCIKRETLQTCIYGNSYWSMSCHGNTKSSKVTSWDLLITSQTSTTRGSFVVTITILIRK